MMPPAEDLAVLSLRAALAARLTRALLRTPAAGACVMPPCAVRRSPARPGLPRG